MIAVRMSFADAAALDDTKTFAKDDGRELLRLLVIDAFTSYAAHLKLWLEKKTKKDKKEAQRTKEAKASCACLCQRRGGAAPAAGGRECPGAAAIRASRPRTFPPARATQRPREPRGSL